MKRSPTLLFFSGIWSLLHLGVVVPAWGAADGMLPGTLMACINYDCKRLQPIQLNRRHRHDLYQLFQGITTPESERQAMRHAVAYMESLTGSQSGTWADRAENDGDPADPGQLDCVAESKNTTAYLRMLEDAGLLRWHTVEARRHRAPWFFNSHWTAVIREAGTATHYAMDSWFLENGSLPILQPLEQWQRGRTPDALTSDARR